MPESTVTPAATAAPITATADEALQQRSSS